MSCKDCPYNGQKKVPFVGNINSKILIYGEAPGETEARYGKPFIGESGKLLFTTLQHICNLTRKDVAIANAIKCKIDDDRKNLTKALKCCRIHSQNLIHKMKPSLIVAFGSTATKQLLGDGSKILSKSGRFFWSDEFRCWILVSIHPSYALRNGITYKDIIKNEFQLSRAGKLWVDTFKAIKSFIDNGYTHKPIDTSSYTEFEKEDLDYILSHDTVAIDYETTGLNPFNSKIQILSLSFTVEEGISKVLVFDTDIEKKIKIAKKILRSKLTKVVANRPFEELFTLAKFGFSIKLPVYDVLTLAHVVNEENCQPYNLEEVANRYAGMQHIKEVAEGQRKILSFKDRGLLIRYNGVDTDATFRAYKTLMKLLKETPSVLHYWKNVVHSAQNLYAILERKGIEINLLDVIKSEKELKEIVNRLHDELIEFLPQSIIEKYKDNLSLTRSAIIVDYLFNHPDGLKLKPIEVTPKTGNPTTTESHLKHFKNKSTFVEKLLEWKKANKILTTYFKQIYTSVNPEDSCIYPHSLFMATKTGRMVIKNPTLQTIPQHSQYSSYIRRLFKAPDGYMLFDRDLGQSELRIMAWLSNCSKMLEALHNNIDLHKQTANLVLGIPYDEVTKEERQSCKAINFGFIYGAQARTFQKVAEDDYGIHFTLEEAEKLREKFFNAYPEILEYHNKIIHFARKHGYVESPLGRRRHLDSINSNDFWIRAEAERQAVNFPIQSFSSDLNLISQILTYKYIRKEGLENEIRLLFLIHDAMFGFVKDGYIEKANLITKKAMEVWSKRWIKKVFGVEIGYPIASDFSIGKDWDSLEEV